MFEDDKSAEGRIFEAGPSREFTTFSNDRLLDVMGALRSSNTKVAVILVDEELDDSNVSNDRALCHRLQASVLLRSQGFGVFLVKFGAEGSQGNHVVFSGGLGPDLDAAIPGNTYVYEKGAMETNGFDNVQLAQDIADAQYTDVIIMGQSTNACCAATARGAAERRLKVHACTRVLRGGGVQSESPLCLYGTKWPSSTTVYHSL